MSSAKNVKIALCQVRVGSNKEENLNTVKEAVTEAAKNGAKMILLPEMFNCPYSNDSFGPYAEELGIKGDSDSESWVPDQKSSPSAFALHELAKSNDVILIGGSLPERDDGKLYNTSLAFDRSGRLLARHRKAHLFDIDIPGKITFKESATLTAGQKMTLFDTEYGKVGLAICYDIRFPEYAQLCAANGASFLALPGAFNMTTGPAHWELLMRSRAMDNQLFVLACSPARNPDASYQAWGHSMACSPFGEVLATAEHTPTTVYAELDLSTVETIRRQLPYRTQKRTDLYTLTANVPLKSI